ncbi:MAG TPA: SIMPL domain-containing protein [Sporichthyaceae bacterium]|nr:SIMPL domain-containing protein [Sporichthyaceae bacterium]
MARILTTRRARWTAVSGTALVGVIAAAIVSGSAGSAAAGPLDPGSDTVSVSGMGQVSATPDVMHLDLGVQRTSRDLNGALNDANSDLARIKAALTKHGVREADIQTSQLSINQHYGPIQPMSNMAVAPSAALAPIAPDVPTPEMATPAMAPPAMANDDVATENTASPAIAPVPPPDATTSAPTSTPGWEGPPGPNGYEVMETVAVTIRNLTDAGATISDAAAAGGDATRINGLSFAIDDNTAVLRQARDAAFADAKAKAEQYAKLAGRSLGKVSVITENSSGDGGGVVYPMYAARSQAAGSPVPISAGSQQVTVTNTVVWQLN